jgi:hypothetical protein
MFSEMLLRVLRKVELVQKLFVWDAVAAVLGQIPSSDVIME